MCFLHSSHLSAYVRLWIQFISGVSVLSHSFPVASMADDFGSLAGTGIQQSTQEPKDKGQKRAWNKVFETLPPQMLNAYGPAKYAKMSDAEVWKHFNQPLKTGAMYMTEFCHKDVGRRGTATNRWLHAVLLFCQYQKEASIQKTNEALLQPDKCKEVYAEIDSILPSLEYCLAPKKVSAKTGSSSLRSSGIERQEQPGMGKDEGQLDDHAKILYEWLDTSKVSRIRMLMHWQSAAGLSYVAAVHHRAAQCFRYQGNTMHGQGMSEVSLTEFQAGIKVRHHLGSGGIGEAPNCQATNDFV